MGNLFRRGKREPDAPDPENRPDQRMDRYYTALVPASARSPEVQRLAIAIGDDENEGPDEDIEFIASLVKEIERTPRPIARSTPAIAPRIETPTVPTEEEKLNVFREMTAELERPKPAEMLKVEDVDMADLIETLSITAAALRRRKAA
jgi:hypothetical protein